MLFFPQADYFLGLPGGWEELGGQAPASAIFLRDTFQVNRGGLGNQKTQEILRLGPLHFKLGKAKRWG